MTNWIRKYRVRITLITFFVMVFSIIVGTGGQLFLNQKGPNDPILEVNSEKVPVRIFEAHYSRILSSLKPEELTDPAQKSMQRDRVLQMLIQNVGFGQEAESYGVQVPDQQIAYAVMNTPLFQEKGVFSPQRYAEQIARQTGLTPQDFESEQRRSIAASKMHWLVFSMQRATDDEVRIWKTDSKNNQMIKKNPENANQFVLEEKLGWIRNLWYRQLGQRTQVKTYLDRLQQS